MTYMSRGLGFCSFGFNSLFEVEVDLDWKAEGLYSDLKGWKVRFSGGWQCAPLESGVELLLLSWN
jgi:hypothetical protein